MSGVLRVLAFGLCGASACYFTTTTSGLSGGAPRGDEGTRDASVQVAAVADAAVTSDAGGTTGPENAYRALVLADAPIAYWRFEESSGSTAVDETGRHDASYVGVQLGAEGIAGGHGVDLAATSRGRIETRSTAFQFSGNSRFAFECWLKLRSLADQPRIGGTEDPNVSSSTGWFFTAADVTAKPYMSFRSASGAFLEEVQGSATIAIDRFVHLVVSHDAATASMWIDGERVANAAWSAATAATGVLTLGCRQNGASQANCIEGVLDEVAIYDHPLAAARVQAHYGAGKP